MVPPGGSAYPDVHGVDPDFLLTRGGPLMLRLLSWLAPLSFILILVAGIVAPRRPAAVFDASRAVLEAFYQEVERVHASTLTPELTAVVEERLDCYAASPLKRLEGRCQARYLQGLVSVGRRRVRSSPDLGVFAASVDICPASFSLCMGRLADRQVRPESETRQMCAALEARCLDLSFDRHWRGAPPPLSLPAPAASAGDVEGDPDSPAAPQGAAHQ